MTSSNTNNRTEQFLIFCRRHLIALLVVIVLLGATAVGLTLSPPGAVRNPENLVWWLSPIGLAITLAVPISIISRRFDPSSPEVRIVTNDEWRIQAMNRAARTALATVLIVQWPLGLLIGFMTRVAPPRAAMAMAAATITIGLTTFIIAFLLADCEPTDA